MKRMKQCMGLAFAACMAFSSLSHAEPKAEFQLICDATQIQKVAGKLQRVQLGSVSQDLQVQDVQGNERVQFYTITLPFSFNGRPATLSGTGSLYKYADERGAAIASVSYDFEVPAMGLAISGVDGLLKPFEPYSGGTLAQSSSMITMTGKGQVLLGCQIYRFN